MKYKIRRKIKRSPVFHCVCLQSTFWYKFYTCTCVHTYMYQGYGEFSILYHFYYKHQVTKRNCTFIGIVL